MSVDLWSNSGPFTVRELAEACRCSPRYVEKCISAGVLVAAKLGRSLRIPASHARAFALAAGVEPSTTANVAHVAHTANTN